MANNTESLMERGLWTTTLRRASIPTSGLEPPLDGRSSASLDSTPNTNMNARNESLGSGSEHAILNIGGLPIRECSPPWDTVEQCKNRLKGFVTYERKCLGEKPALCNLTVLEKAGAEPRKWLDEDYLYRINYGPGTAEDANLAYTALEFTERANYDLVTIVDPRIMAKLHEAIFRHSRQSPYQLNWLKIWEKIADPDNIPQELKGFFTLRDDNGYSIAMEAVPALHFMELMAKCVWDPRLTYSSKALGNESRPPMIEVALDIIDLVQYLVSLEGRKPEDIASCLRKSRLSFKFRSFQAGLPDDDDRVMYGYITDLFSTIISSDTDDMQWEGYDWWMSEVEADMSLQNKQREIIPGPDALGLGKQPLDPQEARFGSLDDLRASFITAGPFRFTLTQYRSQHLTLTNEGEIRLFWEGPDHFHNLRGVELPGRKSFGFYYAHTLGRCASIFVCPTNKPRLLHADTLASEFRDTYSLLFGRDDKSRKIAAQLFAHHDVRVIFISDREQDLSFTGCGIVNWNMHYKGEMPMAEHFRLYSPRLLFLQHQMLQWKPRRFRDLLRPGYKDRFMWYATVVGIVIAALGIVSVITGIVQTIVAFKTYDAVLEAIQLQKLQLEQPM